MIFFLPVMVVRQWHRLSKMVSDSPSSVTHKTQLDIILDKFYVTLFWSGVGQSPEVSSNLNNSVIL